MVEYLAVPSAQGRARVVGWMSAVALALALMLVAPSAAQANTLYALNAGQVSISAFSLSSDGIPVAVGDSLGLGSGGSPNGYLEEAVSSTGQLYITSGDDVDSYLVANGQYPVYESATAIVHPTSPATYSGGQEGVAVSPNGQYVYVADEDYGSIATFAVGADGALTQVDDVLGSNDDAEVPSGVSSSSAPDAVAVSPNGKYLYAANDIEGSVTFFTIGSSGTPTPQATTPLPDESSNGIYDNPDGLAITPNGQSLFVSSYSEDADEYSIGPNGGLVFASTAGLGGLGQEDVATSPNGEAYYTADFGSGTVSEGLVHADGSVSYAGVQSSGPGYYTQPYSVALSPGDAYVYAANYGDNSISTFSTVGGFAQEGDGVDTGVPIGSSPGPVDIGSDPDAVVVSPDNGPSAAYNGTIAPSGFLSTFDASSSSAGSEPIASYAWSFGDDSGQTTATPTVSHVYAKPGTYTVTLTVTDSDGCSTAGPWTGVDATCNSDPSATESETLGVPATTTTPVRTPRPTPIPAPPIPKGAAPTAVPKFTALFAVFSHRRNAALVGLNGVVGAEVGETVTINCVDRCAHKLHVVEHVRNRNDHLAEILPRSLALFSKTRIEVEVSAPGFVSRFVRYGFVRSGQRARTHIDASGCMGAATRSEACP